MLHKKGLEMYIYAAICSKKGFPTSGGGHKSPGRFLTSLSGVKKTFKARARVQLKIIIAMTVFTVRLVQN